MIIPHKTKFDIHLHIFISEKRKANALQKGYARIKIILAYPGQKKHKIVEVFYFI